MRLVRRIAVLAILVICLGLSQDKARADEPGSCYAAARERYEQCSYACQLYYNSAYYCLATCELNYNLDVEECNTR